MDVSEIGMNSIMEFILEANLSKIRKIEIGIDRY